MGALQTVTYEDRLKGESYFLWRREKCSVVADFTYGKKVTAEGGGNKLLPMAPPGQAERSWLWMAAEMLTLSMGKKKIKKNCNEKRQPGGDRLETSGSLVSVGRGWREQLGPSTQAGNLGFVPV